MDKFWLFLNDYWWILFIAVFVTIGIILLVTGHKKKVQEWLKFIVVEIERQLGNGTGELKLRTAYDAFITRFPKMSTIISFNAFSKMVDSALETVNYWMVKNVNVAQYMGVIPPAEDSHQNPIGFGNAEGTNTEEQ